MILKTMRVEDKKYKHGKEELDGLVEFCEYLKCRYPLKKWTLVEVGTYLGESASVFSRYFKKVVTCDPWVLSFMQTYVQDGEKLHLDDLYRRLNYNLRGTKNVEFIRAPSTILANSLKDHSVDMVYIDAWHRVIPCTVDILSWLPKVKYGGVLSGHDYRTFEYVETIPAVRYTLGEPLQVFSDSSWYIPVPKIISSLNKKGRKA